MTDIAQKLYHPNPLTFSNITLIFMFNNPHYEAIPLMQIIYARRFPHIVYCGPNHSILAEMEEKWHVKFIRIDVSPPEVFHGEFMNLRCMLRVMELYPKMGGYLFVHDDVSLNFWNIAKWNKSKLWYTNDEINMATIADFTNLQRYGLDGKALGGLPGWIHAERYKNGTLNALRTIEVGKTNSTEKKCFDTLVLQVKDRNRVFYGQADIYYVPQRLAAEFEAIAHIFTKNNVFFEIAVPTIMNCLDPLKQRLTIKFGHNIWNEKDKTYKKYKTFLSNPYFHPYKLGKMLSSTSTVQFFCTEVLPVIAQH